MWTAARFEGDGPLSLNRLSSAEQRWANLSIRLAFAEATDQRFAPTPATIWLLLDEPERGLHRTAEARMARGIRERSRTNLRAVLATHSPELLDHGIGEVNYVRRRSPDRPGAVVSMRDFHPVREDLGLNPSDMLRRTRGIALLEGEHDLEVLAGMIGPELERLGVALLPTRGAAKLKTVVDSRFLYEFTDATLFPILDELSGPVAALWEDLVAAARTTPASDLIGRLQSELKRFPGKGHEYLAEFLSTSLKNGTFDRVLPLGIPQSDVLACLPVQAFAPKAESWEEVRDLATRSRGGTPPSETEFKKFLRTQYGADLSAENIRRVAEQAPEHPDIKALLAAIAERLSH